MTLTDRMTRCPRAFDADRGADVRVAVPWAQDAMGDLMAGTAGCIS